MGQDDGARSVVQVDVGYGDAITPAPEVADYLVAQPINLVRLLESSPYS